MMSMGEASMARRTALLLFLLSFGGSLVAAGTLQITFSEGASRLEYDLSLRDENSSLRLGSGGRFFVSARSCDAMTVSLGHGSTSGCISLVSEQGRYTGAANRKDPKALITSALRVSFGTPDTLLLDCGSLSAAVSREGDCELLLSKRFTESWYSELYLFARRAEQRGIFRQVITSDWMRSEVSLGVLGYERGLNGYRYAAELLLFGENWSLLIGTNQATETLDRSIDRALFYLRSEVTGDCHSIRHSLMFTQEAQMESPLFDDTLVYSVHSSSLELEVKVEDALAYSLYQREVWKLSVSPGYGSFSLRASLECGAGRRNISGRLLYSTEDCKLSVGFDEGFAGRLEMRVPFGSLLVEQTDCSCTLRVSWELSA